jgi:hypothetical protein
MLQVKHKPLTERITQENGFAASKHFAVAVAGCFLVLGGALLLQAPALAAIPEISFDAASVEYDGMRFERVHAELAPNSRFRLQFESMTGSAEPYLGNGLTVTGGVGSWADRDNGLDVSLSLDTQGLNARLTLQDRPGERVIELSAKEQPLLELVNWPGLPEETEWLRGGAFDSVVTLTQRDGQPTSATLKLDITGLGFDSPEGSYAGESLQVGIEGAWPDVSAGRATVRGNVRGGELLLQEFYRNFSEGALNVSADLDWRNGDMEIPRLLIGDGSALDIEARLRIGPVDAGSDWTLEVERLGLDFPAAYQRYLEPLAAAWTLNGLEVTGRLLWSGEWASGNLVSGDLQIEDLSVVDTQRQRFAVTGLQAHLRPGEPAFSSRLTWRGLLLGRINLGAGEAQLDSQPGVFALQQPLSLDVLGGRLELDTLKVILPGSRAGTTDEPDVRLRARIDGLDMGELTAALGWPSFSGKISGEIPGVSLDDGVLGVDGEIHVDVFGGRIALQNLSLERAFGVLPGLAADMEILDLDLEQLTQTFSFGRIAGRLDGYVRDLRMLDWKPVAFDAWLGTPERQSGSNDISRQAVNRLTTLGGGSATTALTGPLMRMFSNFSYRRLGLGCRLQYNVCHLSGLSEDDASVLLLEGAGVPKITIRAYNRNIDWPQMVSNLVAVSGDAEIRIGQ